MVVINESKLLGTFAMPQFRVLVIYTTFLKEGRNGHQIKLQSYQHE